MMYRVCNIMKKVPSSETSHTQKYKKKYTHGAYMCNGTVKQK